MRKQCGPENDAATRRSVQATGGRRKRATEQPSKLHRAGREIALCVAQDEASRRPNQIVKAVPVAIGRYSCARSATIPIAVAKLLYQPSCRNRHSTSEESCGQRRRCVLELNIAVAVQRENSPDLARRDAEALGGAPGGNARDFPESPLSVPDVHNLHLRVLIVNKVLRHVAHLDCFACLTTLYAQSRDYCTGRPCGVFSWSVAETRGQHSARVRRSHPAQLVRSWLSHRGVGPDGPHESSKGRYVTPTSILHRQSITRQSARYGCCAW